MLQCRDEAGFRRVHPRHLVYKNDFARQVTAVNHPLEFVESIYPIAKMRALSVPPFLERTAKRLQLLGHSNTSHSGMAKRKLAVKCLSDKVCLSDTAATINGDELRFSRICKFTQTFLLFFSSYHGTTLFMAYYRRNYNINRRQLSIIHRLCAYKRRNKVVLHQTP